MRRNRTGRVQAIIEEQQRRDAAERDGLAYAAEVLGDNGLNGLCECGFEPGGCICDLDLAFPTPWEEI